jgi:phosphoglycolate phosphatase-like HAD superfamily hydrolase
MEETLSVRNTKRKAISSRYDAVIFDLDSTLLDTFPAICALIKLTFHQMGYATEHIDEIAKKSWGEHFENMIKRQLLAAGGNLQSIDLVAALMVENFSLDFIRREIKTFVGMDKLLSSLKELGIKLCVLTNTGDPYAKSLADLFYPGLFSCAYGTSDIIFPKPQPSGILYIAEQLSVPAGRILVIGDAMEDILAARAAGTDCLLARWASIAGANSWSCHKLPPIVEAPLDCLAFISPIGRKAGHS